MCAKLSTIIGMDMYRFILIALTLLITSCSGADSGNTEQDTFNNPNIDEPSDKTDIPSNTEIVGDSDLEVDTQIEGGPRKKRIYRVFKT